ncbi:MAG: TrkA family potassium uptake protein [Desulfobacteraceae bacterium]|nr:TrkA family potassium uptake protein [Desulfobacteraceae bacterium]
MGAKYQVGIIGLGKFGLRFGRALIQMGHEVIGVDNNVERVQEAKQELTQVFQADAMNKQALAQLGFDGFNYVLVSVGDSIAASTMITMYLKEMGLEAVWVKGITGDHENLLRKVGADEVIIPDKAAARALADRLAIPGFLEYLPFGKDIALREITVDQWAGKTLRDLELPDKYNIQVIAVKAKGEKGIRFLPKAEDSFNKDDVLIVMGHMQNLGKLRDTKISE